MAHLPQRALAERRESHPRDLNASPEAQDMPSVPREPPHRQPAPPFPSVHAMKNAVSVREAVARIAPGAVVMVGGFMGVGSPHRLIDELIRQGTGNLTLICNDTSRPGFGVGKLIDANLVRKVIASHIGTNPRTQSQMLDGTLEVELVPQGTLAERVRAGGFGLGGILTPTGVGTLVAVGKQTIEVNGIPYLLETALKADVALVAARRLPRQPRIRTHRSQFQSADGHGGNDDDRGSRRHRARRHDFAGCRRDARRAGPRPRWPGTSAMTDKQVIARRVARELKDGDRVNLGIGLPTLVAGYLRPDQRVHFHSENGIFGMSPLPGEGFEDRNLTDAGGRPVGALPGACAFDSAFSFGVIRGGHLDVTVLGGLEVDELGRLANWMVPGKMVPGMGGAMDLVTGARRVIVAMTHRSPAGAKIVRQCSLPITSVRRVDLVVTELAVIRPTVEGLVLVETTEGVTVDQVLAATDARLIVDRLA
jgi:acetate CoA/acetoacetate CoA-transferase beta subunit